MTTDKQREANQQNALLSTGPGSVAGKEESSRGAISHGMTCKKHVVLSWESGNEYWEFFHAMEQELQPEGAHECFLSKQIIDNMWRLGRGARYEAMVEKECPNTITFLGELYKIIRYEGRLERRINKDIVKLRGMQCMRKTHGNPMMPITEAPPTPRPKQKTYTRINAEQVIPPAMLGKNTWADFFANQQVGYPKNTNGFVLSKEVSATPVSSILSFWSYLVKHPNLSSHPLR